MTIESWDHFNTWVGEQTSNNKLYGTIGSPFIWRGQSNYDWPLEPSLLRIIHNSKKNLDSIEGYEEQSIIEFRQNYFVDNVNNLWHPLSDKEELLLSEMQHYGCPTRLMDWSSSAYIALYFAVCDKNDVNGTDGAIFLWKTKTYDNQMLREHPYFEKEAANWLKSQVNYSFVERIIPPKANIRFSRQMGVFSVSNNKIRNHCSIINEIAEQLGEESSLIKIRIPIKLKLELLRMLRAHNINGFTLFSGLEGLSKSVKESLILRPIIIDDAKTESPDHQS